MYLKKSRNKKTGRTQLFIVEAYRDKNKKPKAKVIKTLGYLDVLEKEYDDPIAYFSDMAKRMTEEKKRNAMSAFWFSSSDISKSWLKKYPQRYNLGITALLSVLNELGLYKAINGSEKDTLTGYMNSYIFSKLAVCCSPIVDFTDESTMSWVIPTFYEDQRLTMSDFYRIMDTDPKLMEAVDSMLIEKLSDYYRFNGKLLYFCQESNFKLVNNSNGDLPGNLFLQHTQRGSYGLLTDYDALPLYYSFSYDGKDPMNIGHVMAEASKKLSHKYDRGVIIISTFFSPELIKYADTLSNTDLGYILSFSLRYADEDTRKWGVDPQGFTNALPEGFDEFKKAHPMYTYTFMSNDISNNYLLYKERIIEKQTKAGIRLEKQTVIFSPSFAGNDNRQNESEMSNEAVRCSGYILIVTSETYMSIFEEGRVLLMFEETNRFFSSMASIKIPFPLEGVFKRGQKLFASEFASNYFSYILLKLLEKKLSGKFSMLAILDSLKKCEYIHIENGKYVLGYSDEILSELSKCIDIDLTSKFKDYKTIKNLFRRLINS